MPVNTHIDHFALRSPAWRRRLLGRVASTGFKTLSVLGGATPMAKPRRHGLRREDDVAYGPLPEHLLDVYVPAGDGPHPVAIYIHGGGFRALSKRTHWIMGLALARRGYLTFQIDYRLGPTHRYPAAAEDVCLATRWVLDHAEEYGGDLSRLVVAGESAGGNLCSVVAVASSMSRPEPWAQALFEHPVRPKVVAPFCGMLQVSDPSRFSRRKRLPWYLQDIIDAAASSYLPQQGCYALADPLRVIEDVDGPCKPWPSFFVPCGTADPLLDDSRRLHSALSRHGADVEIRYYPGEVHAFHGFIWRRQARACWKDFFDFAEARLAE